MGRGAMPDKRGIKDGVHVLSPTSMTARCSASRTLSCVAARAARGLSVVNSPRTSWTTTSTGSYGSYRNRGSGVARRQQR
jgi:hypothetical protein